VFRSAFLLPLFSSTFGPVTEHGASFLRLPENTLPYPVPFPFRKGREDLVMREREYVGEKLAKYQTNDPGRVNRQEVLVAQNNKKRCKVILVNVSFITL
jgi:hypothetical protein